MLIEFTLFDETTSSYFSNFLNYIFSFYSDATIWLSASNIKCIGLILFQHNEKIYENFICKFQANDINEQICISNICIK